MNNRSPIEEKHNPWLGSASQLTVLCSKQNKIRLHFLTESKHDLHEQDDDAHAYEEPVYLRVEPHHPVEDGHEDAGQEQEDGQLRQLLGDVVGVDAVGTVEVLTEEDWELHGEDLK